MLKTLHGRLAVTLLGLLLVTGGIELALSLFTTETHVEEVEQRLNLDLAQQITAAKHATLLDADGEIRSDGLAELFHWLMVVNPGIELYLLKASGEVLAYDPMPGEIVRETVALEPIRAFLDGRRRLPILGDDPRHESGRKIFSVAPIPPEGPAKGYLYIVLASQQYDSATERLRGSYVLRLSAWMLIGCVALAALVGWLIFKSLTGPLRRLAARMRAFERNGAEADRVEDASRGDEVALLEASFEQLVERIQGQMEAIRRNEALRRELVANVSHDLRTPIASLQGYLDTLALKKGLLSPAERDEYLTIALRQSERLGKRVAELFELTKLEHDAVELSPESFSINELVQDNVQRYQLQAEERGVELRAEFDPTLPFVEADLGKIERVLENLLENALRFTPAGGSVTIRLSRDGERVRVEVADTGRGMDADVLPHIFERFYRGPDNAERAERGGGLGLAIAQRILKLHGGRIEVVSNPECGSCFSFSLTVASGHPSSRSMAS